MSATPVANAQVDDPRTLRRVITASSVGTLIEWYDFYLFGALATIIGREFSRRATRWWGSFPLSPRLPWGS